MILVVLHGEIIVLIESAVSIGFMKEVAPAAVWLRGANIMFEIMIIMNKKHEY